MLERTIEALEAIKQEEVKISATKNGECIHQAQRNAIGAKLREALVADFMEIFPVTEEAQAIVAYLTEDGLVLEIPNESVSDHITNPNGSGAITVELGFTVKSLEYNAKDRSEAYTIDLAEKQARARAKAEEVAKKKARDASARAKKEKG